MKKNLPMCLNIKKKFVKNIYGTCGTLQLPWYGIIYSKLNARNWFTYSSGLESWEKIVCEIGPWSTSYIRNVLHQQPKECFCVHTVITPSDGRSISLSILYIIILFWCKFHAAFIHILIKWSLQNFAHAMTAQLSWHVQIFEVMWCHTRKSKLNQNDSTIQSEWWAENHQWDRPQAPGPAELLCSRKGITDKDITLNWWIEQYTFVPLTPETW